MQLIVNGNVYDEIKGIFEVEYSLVANTQNIKIIGIGNSSTLGMYIYANGVLIAKKRRLY